MNDKMPISMRELNLFLLSSSGPFVALSIIVFGVAFKIYTGISAVDISIVLVMFFTRSYVEWFFHRYVWHARSLKIGRYFFQNPIAVMHARHHQNPCDITGLLFGGKGVFLAFLAIIFSSYMVIGDIGISMSLAIGFMIILLTYEWFHVLCHSSMAPRLSLLSKIIENHRVHHDENPRVCFSVSSLMADKLLGTTKDAGS